MNQRNTAACLLVLGAALAGCARAPASPTPSLEPTQAAAQVSTPESTAAPTPTSDSFTAARQRMVENGIIAWGITDPTVIEVMGEVLRHEFVPDEFLAQAYANHPLPIGHGQTISQPYMVALMTQELEVMAGDRVLEIGTGSGYQAAVLAELGVEVFTIEIIEPLATAAAERLAGLGYSDLHTRHADGYHGWPEAAPFDAIIVTAAPDHVPQPLLGQLKEGGIMIIPVGPVGGVQELWRIVRSGEDTYDSLSLGGVRFVPLTREEP